MKKNVIFFDLNYQSDSCIANLCRTENLIHVKCNIYDLERLDKSLLYLIEDNYKTFEILSALLAKLNGVNSIIINSLYPDQAMPCEQLRYNVLQANINRNIIYVFEFINVILKLQNNLLITFFLHTLHKKQFLLQNQIYNCFLINLMTTIVNERGLSKNIRVNCISTDNLAMLYQKHIYPYNSYSAKKTSSDLFLLYKFLITSRVTNKIFKL